MEQHLWSLSRGYKCSSKTWLCQTIHKLPMPYCMKYLLTQAQRRCRNQSEIQCISHYDSNLLVGVSGTHYTESQLFKFFNYVLFFFTWLYTVKTNSTYMYTVDSSLTYLQSLTSIHTHIQTTWSFILLLQYYNRSQREITLW